MRIESIRAGGSSSDDGEGPQVADEGRGREMNRTTEIFGGEAAITGVHRGRGEADFAVVFWASGRNNEAASFTFRGNERSLERLIGLEFFSLSSALASNQQSQRKALGVRD
jgi:hypothetical protein